MDTFGRWTNPDALGSALSVPPCRSSGQCDDFSQPRQCYDGVSGRLELAEALLGSSFDLESLGPCQVSSNFDVAGMLSLLQYHDAANLPTESVLASSGTSGTWGDDPSTQLCAPPPAPPMTTADPHDGLLESFAFAKEPRVVVGDDDGISNNAIFSSYSSTGNISSGESSHHDEVASRSKQNTPPLPTRPDSNKRKLEEEQMLGGILRSDYPTAAAGGLHIAFSAGACQTQKRPRAKRSSAAPASITFCSEQEACGYEPDTEAMAQVKEMIYRAAAMRPVNLGNEVTEAAGEKPKRKNVRISSDPQTVAARLRRERVSERLRVLQKLVPGGSKMDTASMLDEAANYLKFLKSHVKALETLGNTRLQPQSQSQLQLRHPCSKKLPAFAMQQQQLLPSPFYHQPIP